MFKKPGNSHAIATAVATAIFMMAGVVRADDGGGEDYTIPAAYTADDGGAGSGSAATCQDLRDAAWFDREMERSDGDVSPAAAAVRCTADVYAESTVDAD